MAVLPSLEEVNKTIASLSVGKAPGADGIHPENFIYGGPALVEKLFELFCAMWTQEELPQEYKDPSITHLYKNKGDRQVCDNHRGISLLAIAGKVLARVLLNRLQTHLEGATQDPPTDKQPSLITET